jgi:hypothetical protein
MIFAADFADERRSGHSNQQIAIGNLQKLTAEPLVATEIAIRFSPFLCVLRGKQVWLFASC